MKDKKVCGMGFCKTGMTLLARALKIPDYKITGADDDHNLNIVLGVNNLIYDHDDIYDEFQDNLWTFFYKELDIKYLCSKCILTLRRTEKWINSLARRFGTKIASMCESIYGAGHSFPAGNVQKYIRIYKQHNKDVLECFCQKPDDLLIFNITKGHGLGELCLFLNEPIQTSMFRNENGLVHRQSLSTTNNSFIERV